MSPEKYDAWYGSARGSWIGKTEYDLLDGLLQVRSRESMLDVGCGTGHFTRAFSAPHEVSVVGVDRNEAALRYAMQHRRDTQSFVIADAHRLPFADRSFNLVISVTALCFMSKERTALVEMLRVARRRVVLGLLNRHSLLYLEKGPAWRSRRIARRTLAYFGRGPRAVRWPAGIRRHCPQRRIHSLR